MTTFSSSSSFSSLFFLVLSAPAANVTSDILGKGRNITDGDTLVSAGGSFTLGFFSPGSSTKRYLVIWFTVSKDAVYWVANRDRPLADTSGALVLTAEGSLCLLDGAGQAVWSSNTTGAAARLLESGNLVTSGPSSSAAMILWQSFDHPSNTLLPGMKVGKNLWTGAVWSVSSWRSAGDPSPGSYRYTTDARAVPENVIWDGGVERYRTGPWNGLWFSGVPEMMTYSDMFKYELTNSPGEITYGYVAMAGAPLSRLLLAGDGVLQRLVWDASSRAWKNFFQGPRDVCDAYGRCGAFGVCDAGAAATSFCGCAGGFSPASAAQWRMRDASGGCRRDVALDCAGDGKTTDGFLVLKGVKLPDTSNASVDATATLEECGERCLANCSCVAYAPVDIRGGGGGGRGGCIIWTDGLVDLRLAGEIKLAHRQFPALIIGASVASLAVVIILTILFVLIVIWGRRRRPRISAAHSIDPSSHAPTVPYVELSSMEEATGNFSESNIIGEGGFGIVYKGLLSDGRKVAVKRLKSSLTDQGSKAFMREVEVMSKLRHGNLVQLLCYCKDGSEHLLVYEYMQNKNLDLYIFGDPELRAFLNWERRLEIIRGVAKGVAYLHDGLSEEVIHRDLKPSNILLDDHWRGYIAPEYAMQGHLTQQQQQHTNPLRRLAACLRTTGRELRRWTNGFGVIILEVISGKRNRATPMLLTNAWEHWDQHRTKDLLDSAVEEPEPDLLTQLERCLQIGLLCVQQSPDDRPTMSAAITMLNSSGSEVYLPKRPSFNGRTGSGSPFSRQEAPGRHSVTIDLA
ncbi:hypothetical protein ACP4OV_026196 [Aristida adscensionis]